MKYFSTNPRLFCHIKSNAIENYSKSKEIEEFIKKTKVFLKKEGYFEVMSNT